MRHIFNGGPLPPVFRFSRSSPFSRKRLFTRAAPCTMFPTPTLKTLQKSCVTTHPGFTARFASSSHRSRGAGRRGGILIRRTKINRLRRAIGRLSVACRTAIGGFRSAIDSQNGVPESITCSRTSLGWCGLQVILLYLNIAENQKSKSCMHA